MSIATRLKHQRALRRLRKRFACIGVKLFFVVLSAGTSSHAEGNKAACEASFNDTQTLRKSGKLIESREAATTCARECPSFASQPCVEWLSQIDASVPSVVLKSASEGDSSGNVYIDDKRIAQGLEGRAIDLNPGRHSFRFEPSNPDGNGKAGQGIQTATLLLVEGEKRRIVNLVLAEPSSKAKAIGLPKESTVKEAATNERGERMSPLVWAMGGTTVVGLAVGASFGILAANRASVVRDNCPNRSCPPAFHDALSSMQTSGTIATVAFVVAGVSLTVGVLGLLLNGPSANNRTSGLHVPGEILF
jgi:hypothetical protein